MKSKVRKIGRFVLPVLIAVSIPVLLARCTPQWLPDSKQFVYLASDGTVVLYNLESEKSTAIAKLTFPVGGVAAWPTGDRIAVVQFPEDGKPKVKVAVYDLTGKELHVSPLREIEGMKLEGGYVPVISTSVSPDGKHLVTFPPGNSSAITYDFEQKKFQHYPGVMPISMLAGAIATMGDQTKGHMPLGFDVPPVTPDGKGFVAIQQGGGGSFVFYRWGEKEPDLLKFAKEERETMEKEVKRPEEQNTGGLATIPRWEMGQLVMRLQQGTLRIDPMDKKCTYKTDMRSEGLLQHAEKHKVIVIAEMADRTLLQINGKRLELSRQAKTTELLEQVKNGGVLALSLSPDGEKILTRNIADGKDVLEVFNRQGERLAKVEHNSVLK